VALITTSELEYVRDGGQGAREDLVSRLQAADIGHMSSLHRFAPRSSRKLAKRTAVF